jgi:hypothetical protein
VIRRLLGDIDYYSAVSQAQKGAIENAKLS